jgi:hypothetical protein
MPPLHVSDEFGMSQSEPHEPQSVSVQMEVSQPLEGSASQLSQPALQAYWQPFVPPQLVEPWAFEHEFPHERQCVSVPSCVSQPVDAFMSQFPQPLVHAPSVQVPAPHDSAAFGRSQSTSQSPQSVRVRMLRSQPLPRSPSQLLKPV